MRNIQQFRFVREPSSRAVVLAHIESQLYRPSDLVDFASSPAEVGTLGVWKDTTPLTSPADFVAPDFEQDLAISGTTNYYLDNQYFELTNVSSEGVPLYYRHPVGDLRDLVLQDLSGKVVNATTLQENGYLYHSIDIPCRVTYINAQNQTVTELLQTIPAVQPNRLESSPFGYFFLGRQLTVWSIYTYWIRFLRPNGYQLLPPYGDQPNAPWYARVGYSLEDPAPEWGNQPWLPSRPYLLATWVPGTVLDLHLLEFERKPMLDDPDRRPDILVYDKAWTLKYAIDGTPAREAPRRGALYPWRRDLIRGFDAAAARVEISVELAADDRVFGFYSYREPDVVFRDLDINPFTNSNMQNRVALFYTKNNGADTYRRIFYQVLGPDGLPVPGMTNDPAPATGTNVIFGELAVGTSIGTGQFTVTDVRQKGGGLAPAYQEGDYAGSCWDLSWLDGKPYPLTGASMVYLPSRLLDTMSRDQIRTKLEHMLPLGTLPAIFYYQPNGEDTV
jgi:hypothetical protein